MESWALRSARATALAVRDRVERTEQGDLAHAHPQPAPDRPPRGGARKGPSRARGRVALRPGRRSPDRLPGGPASCRVAADTTPGPHAAAGATPARRSSDLRQTAAMTALHFARRAHHAMAGTRP